MPDMDGVLGNEAVAEIIEGRAELRRSGGRFGQTADGIESEIRAAHQHRRHLRMVGRSAAAIVSLVRAVKPIINPEAGICHSALLVCQWKSREQERPHVCLALS